MKDESVKRNYYWIVEAVAHNGKLLYSGDFKAFDSAWEKYQSFKSMEHKATVSLQRRFKEYKIA